VRALLLAPVACALLLACAGPRPPAWQTDAHGALERFRVHYLEGDSARARRDFAEAMARIGSTGRLDLAARAELLRCAVGTAALDFDACAGYAARSADAGVDDRAYGHFVSGEWDKVEAGRLAPRYRRVFEGNDEAAQNAAVAAIDDPLSRLVASGTLFRLGRLSGDGLERAIETASAQGFRRPLMALLAVQAKRAEAAGDDAALAQIRRRIELLAGPPAD
jgi:hypothetical protein